MRRVAITGIGLVTAFGVGTPVTWARLLQGDSAIGPISAFDASSLGTRIGAEIRSFSAAEYVSRPRILKFMTRADQFAFVAATLAIREAGWQLDRLPGDRAGVFTGGNKEMCDPEHLSEALVAARSPEGVADMFRFGEAARTKINPLFYVQGVPGSSLFFISEAFGMMGANAYFAGTAESGLAAIGAAFRAIRRGEADVAVAGGFDEPITWWNLSKLDAIGILSDRNDLGAAACRPFDRARSGSVLGDGAAFLALEELEVARRRSATIYAEVTGYGAAFDNRGLLSPDPSGSEVTRAVHASLRDAGVAVDAVDYVVAHGSATRLGDVAEARGLRTALGATADRVAASAIKAGTGHLVAGAGALNAAVAALATLHGEVPPTLNLESPDPECRLNLTPLAARRLPIHNSIAIARGIEGQAAVLALRKV